jgi:acyl-CoA synthetase (AMP-forming)/AMP-acid ligase II
MIPDRYTHASAAQETHYRKMGFWRDETLVDIAWQRVTEAPSKTLVIEGTTLLSRETVWNHALRLAAFFSARGLAPGEVVSFQLPNWSETLVIALAARMLGLAINPIPPIYRESEVSYILNDCGSKLLFIPASFRSHDYPAMLSGIRRHLTSLEHVVCVRGQAGDAYGWNDVLSFTPLPVDDLPRIDAASVMMVMYTSGTTGRPKGVLHTHHSYDYKIGQMGEFWRVCASDVIFMPSPVTHISGAFWSFDMPWVRGATAVLMDVWNPADAIQTIDANRCTISGGATPFLQQLLAAAAEKPDALKSLRMFFCGGTTVSPELVKKASTAFPDCLFFRAYGSTEMPTAAMGIRDRSQARLGAETDGEVAYPVEIKIVDDAGRKLEDGLEGEILARGPELFAGYLHEEDNRSCFDAEGFFRMGDLGRLVHGGYLVITGRKKDIIIRSGENISPKEVEDILLEHPAVDDVAIVAMPSRTTGECGCAFLILKSGISMDLPEIQRYLAEQGLARQKFPEHLVLVDELPRVASGKIRKDVLRDRARELANIGENR